MLYYNLQPSKPTTYAVGISGVNARQDLWFNPSYILWYKDIDVSALITPK